MKTSKSIFTLIFLFVLNITFANINLEPKAVNEIKTQLSKMVSKLTPSSVEGETIYVNFIVTEANEILVSSTSSKQLDLEIKKALNGKKLNSDKLEAFKMYTLPIVLKK